MSAAAERRETDTALPSPKSARRSRKRKAGEAAERRRRQTFVLAGAIGFVQLLLFSAVAVKALRPAKPAETPRAPVAVAASQRVPAADRPTLPPAEPALLPVGPQAPAFPPATDARDDAAPPPRPELLVPEPLPMPAPLVEAKPKPDDAAPKPPAPAVAAGSANKYKGPTEFDLLRELANTQDFGLTPYARQSMPQAYMTEYQASARLAMRPAMEPSTLLSYFPAAAQLPIRNASICQLGPREAEILGVLARKLHIYIDLIAPFDAQGRRKEPIRLREVLRNERRGKRPEWLRPEAVPAIVQILMHEDVPLRLLMVELLSEIDGAAATTRLAQRAVFDLSPQVRAEAIAALRSRPRDAARPVFVNAFRYPWPRAAIHAAEALTALGDDEIAPLLVAQLDKPDPALPYTTADGRVMVRDVVHLDHVQNCLICHAPAFNGRDPVVGIDPVTIRPNSTLENPNLRYPSQVLRGDQRSGIWANNLLIRADVQFVRQDFSVTFPVRPVFDLLQGRRIDFVVRTRQLKGEELREYRKQEQSPTKNYPQRDATLTALKAVTGRDAGPTTDAWVKLYPHAGAEAEGLRISEALLRQPGSEQAERLLAKYRDSKDDGYTEGLARAIPHIGGKLQGKTREALIVRLTRLSAEQLRDRLGDDDEELRHAAAVACCRRLDPDSIPDLISLLFSEDSKIMESARKSLQILTDEDFFPADAKDPHARALAAARWQAWLRQDTQP